MTFTRLAEQQKRWESWVNYFSGSKYNVKSIISKSVSWSFNEECISMFFLNLWKEACTLPSLGISHHWAFRGYNFQKKQSQNFPLDFLKFFPEFLATFKKLCFRIPLNVTFLIVLQMLIFINYLIKNF